MEDCLTPTLITQPQFLFNVTPTAIQCSKEVHKLMASRRSFTPIPKNFLSPGLSPIYKVGSTDSSPVTTHHSSSFQEFKKPSTLAPASIEKLFTPSSSLNMLSPHLASVAFGKDLAIASPASTSYSDYSNEASPQYSDRNIIVNTSILNHALTIQSILKSLGLENYCDVFENAGLNFNNMKNFNCSDLKNIGINSEEDCRRIIKTLKQLNLI